MQHQTQHQKQLEQQKSIIQGAVHKVFEGFPKGSHSPKGANSTKKTSCGGNKRIKKKRTRNKQHNKTVERRS
jgi:hypothetical protein